MATHVISKTDATTFKLPLQEFLILFKAISSVRDVNLAIKKLRLYCLPYIEILGHHYPNVSRFELYLVELPTGQGVLATTTSMGGAAIAAGAIHCSAVFRRVSVGQHIRKAYNTWRMDVNFPGPAATLPNLIKVGLPKWQ